MVTGDRTAIRTGREIPADLCAPKPRTVHFQPRIHQVGAIAQEMLWGSYIRIVGMGLAVVLVDMLG